MHCQSGNEIRKRSFLTSSDVLICEFESVAFSGCPLSIFPVLPFYCPISVTDQHLKPTVQIYRTLFNYLFTFYIIEKIYNFV